MSNKKHIRVYHLAQLSENTIHEDERKALIDAVITYPEITDELKRETYHFPVTTTKRLKSIISVLNKRSIPYTVTVNEDLDNIQTVLFVIFDTLNNRMLTDETSEAITEINQYVSWLKIPNSKI